MLDQLAITKQRTLTYQPIVWHLQMLLGTRYGYDLIDWGDRDCASEESRFMASKWMQSYEMYQNGDFLNVRSNLCVVTGKVYRLGGRLMLVADVGTLHKEKCADAIINPTKKKWESLTWHDTSVVRAIVYYQLEWIGDRGIKYRLLREKKQIYFGIHKRGETVDDIAIVGPRELEDMTGHPIDIADITHWYSRSQVPTAITDSDVDDWLKCLRADHRHKSMRKKQRYIMLWTGGDCFSMYSFTNELQSIYHSVLGILNHRSVKLPIWMHHLLHPDVPQYALHQELLREIEELRRGFLAPYNAADGIGTIRVFGDLGYLCGDKEQLDKFCERVSSSAHNKQEAWTCCGQLPGLNLPDDFTELDGRIFIPWCHYLNLQRVLLFEREMTDGARSAMCTKMGYTHTARALKWTECSNGARLWFSYSLGVHIDLFHCFGGVNGVMARLIRYVRSVIGEPERLELLVNAYARSVLKLNGYQHRTNRVWRISGSKRDMVHFMRSSFIWIICVQQLIQYVPEVYYL